MPNTGKLGSREPSIRFAFNQYEKAFCELPHNQCQQKCLHKCQTCGQTPLPVPNHSVKPNSDPNIQQMLYKFMQSMITLHMEKVR